MTPMTAIEAATFNAADLLGLGAQIGTIEPGKSADIVAVRGDPWPTSSTSRDDFVMARGRVHPSRNHDSDNRADADRLIANGRQNTKKAPQRMRERR